MGVIRSHWKLAFRTTRKAIAVTFQTLVSMNRSRRYTAKVWNEIRDQREHYAKIEKTFGEAEA